MGGGYRLCMYVWALYVGLQTQNRELGSGGKGSKGLNMSLALHVSEPDLDASLDLGIAVAPYDAAATADLRP